MNDILLNSNYDLLLVNGKMQKGESTKQHQALLLLTNKGEWRFSLITGVGLKKFLKDEDGTVLGEIKEQFEKDGMQVDELTFNNGVINANASYK